MSVCACVHACVRVCVCVLACVLDRKDSRVFVDRALVLVGRMALYLTSYSDQSE